MKKLLFVVVLLMATIANAAVLAGSLHRSDMSDLNMAMMYEYDGVDVMCSSYNGNDNIGIAFNSRWTGSDYQVRQVGYAIGAGGYFTENTTWRSGYLLISFIDYAFMCTTRSARYFTANAENWTDYQVATWINLNLTGSEI